MRKTKIAIALALLAGLVTLAIMADSNQLDRTAPAAEPLTVDQFIFIAKAGAPEELQAAIDSGFDINEPDRLGRTALTEALLVGANANALALLEAGADVRLAGREGYTPLILASNNGDLDLVNTLLEKGADPRRANDIGVTALHTAGRSTAELIPLTQIVGALLKAGADPNAADDQGFTPLMVFASRGRVDPMILLLDAGARINQKNELGMSAIMYAIMSGDFAIRAGWEIEPGQPSDAAAQKLGVIALALEQADSLGAVRLLLSRGADINYRDDDGGWTPIMRAAGLGDIERYRKVIINAGGNPDTPEAKDRLDKLVKLSRADNIVLTLRNADAYVNLPNDQGADALTISRARIDPVGKLIHGLLLEGKRVTQADVTPGTHEPGDDPGN